MAEVNTGLSVESQHVVNALEAHLAAVKLAVAQGEAVSEPLLNRVENFAAEVFAQLRAWGLQLAQRGELGSQVVGGAGEAGEVEGGPTGQALATSTAQTDADLTFNT
jgi:hypothetical protein